MTNQNAANSSQPSAQDMQGAKILDLTKITQDTSNPCVLENDDIANTLTAPLGVERPEAGEIREVALQPGQNLLFAFNEGEVSSIVENCGDLVMDFQNGGQLILTNFSDSVSADLPPVLAFAGDAVGPESNIEEAGDGEIVDISEIIESSPADEDLDEPQTSVRETVDVVEAEQEPSAVEGETTEELNAEALAAIESAAGEEELAEELAAIEPAAGDDAGGSAGNSGFGFGSSFEATGVIPLADVGPINPTALQYGITRPNDDLGLSGVSPSDDRPIVTQPGEHTVDETALGVNTITDAISVDFGNDTPGEILVNGDFTVGGSLLNNNLSSGGSVVTITSTANGYVGTINGGATTVFDFTLNNNGQYTFNQYLPLDHAADYDPNDVIQLGFGFAARDADGDASQSYVVVNVLDDAPVAIAPDTNSINEKDLSGGDIVINDSLVVDFGNDAPGALTPNGTTNVTGVSTLTSGGDAITITQTANGYIGTLPGGATAFEITIDPTNGDYTFTLKVPLDNAPGNDPIVLDFGVIATDFDGDSVESTISINIVDSVPEINDTPTVGAGIENVDETNIPLNGTTVNGSVDVDFGADQPGSITITGTPVIGGSSAAGTSLTSGGQPVTITQVGNGYVGTINGGADTVFTFTLDPTNGDYAFEQVLPLDHADSTNPNDVITIEFPVTATDSDGDTDTGSVVINVADDGPVANDDVNGAEEGQDITGSFVANDVLSQDNANTVTEIEFNGVTYPVAPGVPAVVTTPLGTLTANSDGTYSFSATDVGDPDGTVTFTYTLTDGDGDSDTADLAIRVTPDGEPVAVSGEMLVDETNLTPGPLTTTGTAVVDFGLDGPGTITPSGTFAASESVAGGNLTSGGQPVTVTATANGYVGTINGGATTIFTLVITDATTGAYSFELNATLDHADNTDPNDTIRLNFGVTAADSDGDTVDGTINVLVLDDAPVALDDTNSAVESQTVTGNVLANDESSEDTPTTVVQISFNGATVDVVAGGTSVTGTYGTLTINPDGSYSYTANANNPEGADVFGYVVEDYDGDRETADLTIDVAPIDDKPVIDKGFEVVDETDLSGGNVVVNGTLTVDYGTDGPGTITPASFDSSGSQLNNALTSGGQPVSVSVVGNTYTGTTPGGEVIFTMEVNPNGTYEFTLIGTLDHADPNDPNDIINLEFTVNAQDSDDDVTPTTIVVAVKDDVPVVRDSQGDVDETNFDNGPLVHTDTLFTDFGQDVGSIAVGNNAVATVNGNPIALTSNGDAITITATPTGYEGTTNNGATTVFTINIDPTTGQYVYTQLATLDHPDGTNPDDVIRLSFDFDVTSTENESVTGTVNIDVADDGVDAVDDVNNAEEGQTITGSFVSNDDLSNDTPNEVTEITFNGTTTPIPSGGSATVVTPLGTLIANSDGTYSFTATSVGDPDGDVTFTYRLTDGDTDTDTAQLTISVTPDGEPQSVNGEQTVDETDLTPGPETVSGAINVDYGIDGAGTVESNGTFTFGQSVANGQLTSSGVPVTVTPTATGYVGTANGQPVFTLTLNPQTLTYEFVLQGTLDHADGTDPNDTIELNFGVTAKDSDGDAVDGTIKILVVDDAPVAYDDTGSVGENQTVTTGNVTANDEASEDTPSTVTTIKFGNNTVAVDPVNGATINGDHGVLQINPNGSYTYTSNATNIVDVVDVFTYAYTDSEGDTDTAELTINVADPDVDPELVTPDPLKVDETDIDPSGTDTDSDTLVADFGVDAPGTFEVTGANTFGFSGAANNTLTSNGVAVTVAVVGNSYVGSANGAEVFRLDLNQTTGEYEFVLTGTLDHADATDPNDAINLRFGVTAKDSDGDTDTGVVNVTVLDDGPSIESKAREIDEDGLVNGPITYTHTLTHDYGQDGAGTIEPTGNFVAKFEMNGANVPLTANGRAITVTETANGYVGTAAGGDVIFTLTVNNNGQYTYTQFDGIDHPDTTSPDDVIWLKFEVEITDFDGDTDTAYIIVDVEDGGPVAVNDTDQAETGETVTGNVITNDNQGPDDPAEITRINGLEITGGSRTVQGAHGSLTINSDGTYSYTANNSVPDGSVDTFTYRLTDADGDTSAATLKITIDEDVAPIVTNDTKNVDETGGFDTVTGTVNVNYGVDGPGEACANGQFSSSDATFTSLGQTINVTNTGTTYTGTAGGRTIFTMTIQPNGSYTFTQLDQIDHPNGNNPNDIVSLNFGVKGVDADGDIGNGTVTINVVDDAPIARDDVDTAEDGKTVTGNVITNNDTVGADAPGKITTIDGQAVPAGGATVVGTYGTLTINPDGSYSYTANNNTPGGVDTFDYKLADYDGDTDTATLKITVSKDDKPVVTNDSKNVDETGGFDTVTGTVNVNYGGDGPGEACANGQFSSSDATFTSLGQTINVTNTGTTYTGTAGGRTIFTMTIQPNGSYTFTQLDQIDHPNGNNPNDIVSLNFGVKGVDADGDIGNGTVTINVVDDAPIAVNDTDAAEEGQTVTGSVITNDTVGADAPGTITQINGQTIPAGGTTVVGTYGSLTINPDGSYSYTANNNNPDGVDTFTYTLADYDGDTDTATLKITVSDDDQPIVVDAVKNVDETGGFDTVNGTVNVNYGGDGPGTTAANGTFTSSDASLTSLGQTINVTNNGTTYTGTAGGRTIFTMTINANGSYTFKQIDQIDHPNSNNPNDIVQLRFGVTATDQDGDTGTGLVKINVYDDGPSAVNDTKAAEEGQTVSGNVITNDTVGADAPGTITQINGQTIGAGGKTINGTYGSLTINQDGTYSYTANNNVTGTQLETFTYTLADYDGDTDTAQLKITVSEDHDPVIGDACKTVDETKGFDTVNGSVSVDFGGDGPGTVFANGTFSASDSTFTSLGQTINVSNTGTTYTGTAGGRTIFTLKVNSNGTFTFTQHDQIDHPNASDHDDIVDLFFGITGRDADGDTDTGTIQIKVRDDGPCAIDDTNTVNESSSVSGNVMSNDHQGADAPGTIAQINGQNIGAGGKTIQGNHGSLTIHQDGSYTYTSNRDVNTVKYDNFWYRLDDSDGDQSWADIKIKINPHDDKPVVVDATKTVDETGGFDSVSGSISVNYGGDGPGTTSANGSFSASDSSLTSLGQTVNVSRSGNTYTGTAGGRTIFTMKINANGTYDFRQFDQLDHPNASNPNDNIALRFGVTARDSDGDTDTGTVTINVRDDGPNAVNDTKNLNEGATKTGNVMSNDTVGADAPGKITHINGQVIGSGGKTINGTYGKLTINQDGSYSYKANANVDGTKTDSFTYKLKDYDGDVDTATLKVNVTGVDSKPQAVDDRVLNSHKTGEFRFEGNLLDNDSFGGDGPGSPKIIAGTGTVNFAHGSLTIHSNGHWILTVHPWVVGNHNYHKDYTIQDADGDTSTARLSFTVTPLALDLDGDGVELTNVENGVLFDYDIDGEVEQTAWVESDDGFLVHDLNGDGIINDRSEMFGDLFGFGDGFAHLGSLDSNGDNKISAEDDQWSELQVWRDLNQDGVTDEGELISLDDLNIESIDLNAETTDQTIEGNYISSVSTYTTTDGVTHEIVDAHLNYEELSEADREALDLSNYLAEGSEVIYGTEGADEFVFDAITGGVDEIMDFDAGEGDKIDLTGLLGEYDATQDAIDDFVFQSVENGNTVVSVDVTGSGDANNATTIAVLNGVDSLDLDTAIKTNTDIV